ncbi:Adenosine/adenine deaminase [Penicillium occitanis (nom. inval.)]|nr:hypothetical protein PENOC_103160 [Penicillium occitanis (nom. inval.)]PCH06406.1 Adenosine/adenine deaminase [Penicillium occitanis (nom. inval.)]
MGIEDALPRKLRQKLREDLLAANDAFVRDIPKVELHVHIEGTLTPELRWKLAQRNGLKVKFGNNGPELHSMEELRYAMNSAEPKTEDEEREFFFASYYGAFDTLKTKRDYFELAMNYFEHVASMNVRYCEVFFDPQGHTSRGISWDVMMGGFKEAQMKAQSELNVRSSWIMCLLRDLSPEDAMDHYKAALPYRDMIAGIGLDSNEYQRPPLLFQEVFSLARRDGFRITMHCDVGQDNTHEHIRQVASEMGGNGADRIDHGLNAADRPELMDLILKRDIGMTICPWAYMRYQTYSELGPKMRLLFDAGIRITINSDDPAFMDDAWILHNWLLTKHFGFTDEEIVTLARNAVTVSWASQSIKDEILREIVAVYKRFYPG